jgi:hypothetical protein
MGGACVLSVWEAMPWIGVAQDTDQWRTLVNTAMKLWVLQAAGNLLSASEGL